MTNTDQSNNTQQAANNTTAEVAEPAKKPEAIFAETFEKRGKAVARVSDDQTAFTQFIVGAFNEANPYKDWASENAKKLGENVTFAMVLCEENGENRLIALASKEAMFGTGGDEVVKETAYRLILNRGCNIAAKADTNADMFATVGGFLKARFDVEVYKAFAKDVIKVLHAKGLRGITVPTLRLALSNAAYAKATFSAVTDAQWDVVFAIFQLNGEEAQMDTSILTHWKNTRHAMTDAGAGLEEFTLESFAEAMKAEEEGDAS